MNHHGDQAHHPQRLTPAEHEHFALRTGRFLFEVCHLAPHNAASILNARCRKGICCC